MLQNSYMPSLGFPSQAGFANWLLLGLCQGVNVHAWLRACNPAAFLNKMKFQASKGLHSARPCIDASCNVCSEQSQFISSGRNAEKILFRTGADVEACCAA